MLDRVKAEFRTENQTDMLVIGLSMIVIGVTTASAPSEVGIGLVLGTVLLVGGILMLVGTHI
jgi:uncharacterized membrane protein HdeD (DUF308 family)